VLTQKKMKPVFHSSASAEWVGKIVTPTALSAETLPNATSSQATPRVVNGIIVPTPEIAEAKTASQEKGAKEELGPTKTKNATCAKRAMSKREVPQAATRSKS